MEVKSSILLTLLVFTVACRGQCGNGYTIEGLRLQNCGESEAIISFSENASLFVNDDCSLSIRGCTRVKPFATGTGQMLVTRNGKKLLVKSIDACNADKVQRDFGSFLPVGSCPQQEVEICNDPTMRLPTKRALPLRGEIMVEMTIEHDTGFSCLRLWFQVSRK